MKANVRQFPLVVAASIAVTGFHSAQARVYISKDPDRSIACSGGVCTATAPHAVLNVKRLTRMLALQDVTVRGTGSAMDIFVEASVDWSSAHRLTLDSYRSIDFFSHMTVTGAGGVTLITNDGGTGGDFRFNGSESYVRFWDLTSSFIANGLTYVLENDLHTLASDIAANPSGNYALVRDYDASEDGTYKQPPVVTEFSGEFEGLGNAVENLTVDGSVSVVQDGDKLSGLFARNDGVLRDIRVVDATVSGQGKYLDTGALVGENGGQIINASSSGEVSGIGLYAAAGGLVGWNVDEISSSSSSASVNSDASSGGLAGVNWGGIHYSYASGPVLGVQAGGLVGYNQYYGAVDQSFATGSLDCPKESGCGGLVGTNSPKGAITNTYALGAVTAESGGCHDDVGGLVAYNRGKISASYAVGSLSGPRRDLNLGGLLGGDYSKAGSLSNTYWDLETTGVTEPSQGAGNVSNDPGITGLSTEQLQSGLPAGFDPTIWKIDPSINGGFPYLLATAVPAPLRTSAPIEASRRNHAASRKAVDE